MSAYEGFDDEETKATVQRLKLELEEANKDLEADQYDKYISDTSTLLDELYLQYQNTINERIDNIDFLLQQVIDGINAAAGAEGTITGALGSDGVIASLLRSNTSTIGETLKTEVGNVGAKLSTAMSNIWLGDGSGKAVIDLYGKDFQGKQTTTNNVLNNIKSDVAAMVDDVDKDAKKKVTAPKTQPSTQANPTNNTPKAPPTNNQSSNNAKALTDDKLKGIAASIWIYGDGSGWGNDPIRSGKLTKKFGLETAKKVQSIIDSQGASGELYKFWIKKNKNLDAYKYSAFKLGAKDIDKSQLAWTQEQGQEYIVRPSDGAILTPVAKGDSVLTSAASSNIWQMANSPAEFIKDNLGIGSAGVPNNSTVQNSYSQTIENVVFRMDNVKNYDEMLSALQSDKNFERLVESMSLGKIAGKSSLAKGKAIR